MSAPRRPAAALRARAPGGESGGVRRRASPRPPPRSSHSVLRSFSPPLSFPAEGGPGAKPVGVTAPAQAQCSPAPALHGCEAGMSRDRADLASSALAQQRSVEALCGGERLAVLPHRDLVLRGWS